jgi:hypothetical protein
VARPYEMAVNPKRRDRRQPRPWTRAAIGCGVSDEGSPRTDRRQAQQDVRAAIRRARQARAGARHAALWSTLTPQTQPDAMSPWHVVLVALAGWLNREQQKVIEYLKEENRVPREQLGTKHLRFTDEQRRHLAVKGKDRGTKILRELG